MKVAEISHRVADGHVFGEAAGGYTECSCGWPTKDQYQAGEPAALHVLRVATPLIRERIAREVETTARLMVNDWKGGMLHAAEIIRRDDDE